MEASLFDLFSYRTLLLIFSFLHLLGRIENLKLILPFRGQEMILQIKKVIDNENDQTRVCAVQLGTRCQQGSVCNRYLEMRFELPDPPVVPERVAVVMSVIMYFLRMLRAFKLVVPLSRGDKLLIRFQEVHRSQIRLYAIQIGTRGLEGHYLYFKVLFR